MLFADDDLNFVRHWLKGHDSMKFGFFDLVTYYEVTGVEQV